MIKNSEAENLILFNFILNSAQDSIFTKNPNREYTYINQAMARLFGCRPEDLLGKKPADVFNEENARIVNEVDDQTFLGKTISEKRELKIGNELKVFHTIQSPMYDDNERIIGICGIVRDLTEFYNMQLKLFQSERISAVGQLAAGIAHEFNNILAIIALNAQFPLLKYEEGDRSLSEKNVRNLNNILKSVNKGKSMVSDIMSFARPKEPEKTFCNIESVIEEVIRFHEHQLELEHIGIIRNYNETPKVFIDRNQFEQVFFNLFVNARHAILPNEKGNLTLQTNVENDQVVIRITDDGIGISEENQKKLFTPFFTTKGAFANDHLGINGSGLGLSIVFSIIQNHNAQINVESQQGVGTTIRILIPLPVQPDTTQAEMSGIDKLEE